MTARQIITESVPPLHPDDSGEKALNWMHEFAVHQLPVVEDGKLINLISMDDVINQNDFALPLRAYKSSYVHPFVSETAHILEVMKLCAELNITVVPVIDEDEQYVGLITSETLVRNIADLSSLKVDGSVIELEIPLKDYSLNEIARIVEGNEAQILSSYSNINKLTAKVDVTLKLNTTNLSAVAAAFERYEYAITGIYHETGYTEDLKEKYDEFMRYLNV
jgi:acetoin utilization protein AcuB